MSTTLNDDGVLGSLFRTLLGRPGTVIIHTTAEPGECRLSHFLDHVQGGRTVSREDLIDLLKAAVEGDCDRPCARCRRVRPFSKGAKYCKECERARWKKYDQTVGRRSRRGPPASAPAADQGDQALQNGSQV